MTYQNLSDFYKKNKGLSSEKTFTLIAEKDGKTIKKDVTISQKDLGEANQLATLNKIYKYDQVITEIYTNTEEERRVQHLKFKFKEDDKSKELEEFLK